MTNITFAPGSRSRFRKLETLDFSLHPFVRVSWVGDSARLIWEPRFRRITTAWRDILWRSVEHGVRQGAVVVESLANFSTARMRWAEWGLEGVPLEMELLSGGPFFDRGNDPSSMFLHIAVARAETLPRLREAWEAGDVGTLGEIFGYPPCCVEFYRGMKECGAVDSTWQAALLSDPEEIDERTLEVEGPAETNFMLSRLGLGALPHLPCSLSCEGSAALGRRLLDLGRDLGYAEETDLLLEILSWPAEWSALHGIAEVKTPLLKMATDTDATPRKQTVRRAGTRMPGQGARGLRFPYIEPRTRVLSDSDGFRRGLNQVISIEMPGKE